MRILLTGFEPFGGDKHNPAQRICEALSESKSEHWDLRTCILPVSFTKAPIALWQAVEEVKPEIAICLGYSAKADCFVIERIALNIEDARIADNDHYRPQDTLVEPEGALALETTLPIRALDSHLRERGIPARISYTAGTFVCNTVFYTLLLEGQTKGYPRLAGFIHVPALPEMALEKREQAFLPLEYIVSGIREILEFLIRG